ncbi:hypothetical protein ICNMLN_ICNMLN_06145, partial [Dysosmobacter welbionis]
CHGLQAQSHAVRADLLSQPLPDGGRHERPHDRLRPVVGADPGRLRQPPHLHARGLPLRRRHPASQSERHRRAPRQREDRG